MKTSRYIFRLLLGVILLTTFAASYGARKDDWDKEAAARKAEYVFLRACGPFANDSLDAGMMLLQRAHEINPADIDIASYQATALLSIGHPDSAQTDSAYQRIRRFYFSNPADYVSGETTATVARALRRYDDVIAVWSKLDSLYGQRTDPAVNLANSYVLRYVTYGDTADISRAIGIFNRLESGTGREPGLTSQKIRAYALLNDTVAINAELDSLIASKPQDVTSYLLAGNIYENLGIDSLALLNYKKACATDSTDGHAFVQIARLYSKQGDSIAYDREVFQALESPSLEFDAKYELLRGYVSDLYNDSLQWPRIEQLFKVLEEVNPGEADIHNLYGAFELRRDKTREALEQFQYGMALDPSNVNTRMTVVQLLAQNDSMRQSIDVARAGIDLFPDNFYFPIMAASGYNLLGEHDKAVDVLRSVKVTDVKNEKAYSTFLTSLGDAYYQADMVDSAFVTYERAIKYDNENFMAYNNAAYFLAEKDRELDKALRYARFAILSDANNPTYMDTYAWVYFKKGDYAEARKQIDATLALYGREFDGDSLVHVFEVADTIVAIDSDTTFIAEPGEEDDAVRTPDSPANVAADEVSEEVPVEVVDEVDAVEEPVPADVLEHAGDIYFMTKDPAKALVLWRKAAELDPDNPLLNKKIKNKAYYYE